jgi:hypothetical protein
MFYSDQCQRAFDGPMSHWKLRAAGVTQDGFQRRKKAENKLIENVSSPASLGFKPLNKVVNSGV